MMRAGFTGGCSRPILAIAPVALLLAACAGIPQKPGRVAASMPAPTRAPAPAHASDLPVLPPAGSGRGAYYQDDGPGEAPPAALMDVPDADVRNEPYSTHANRPYVVFGKTYTPILDDRPFVQRGVGSWYGKKFHGQRTSSGELYDMYKMTAAHPTLPIPSYARVTSLVSGKQVIVRINDRGPFHAGRVVDLSYTAALKLGLLSQGSHEVEVVRLLPAEIDRIIAQRRESAAPPPSAAEAVARPAPPQIEALMLDDVVAQLGRPSATQGNAVAPDLDAAPASGFYLQLGAFGDADKAEAERERLTQAGGALSRLEVVQSGELHRVFIGPFASRIDASEAAQRLPAALALKPVIVKR
jgi:rare lipoprotein A